MAGEWSSTAFGKGGHFSKDDSYMLARINAGKRGFIAGVEWYRKGLWRNSTDEQPQAGKLILIKDDEICLDRLPEFVAIVPGVLWCYVDDLMPKEKEK